MKIDEFDSHVLDQSGDAQDIMLDVYGDEIGRNNAEKQLAGIRKHLNFKRDNQEESVLPLRRKYGVEASGVQVREKLILLSEDDMQNPATVLQKMGLDPVQWELVTAEFEAKSWDVTMKLYNSEHAGTNDETGIDKRVRLPDRVHQETNWGYNCKIRTKPTETPITIDTMRNVLQGITIPTPKKYKYAIEGTMLEIGMPDIHLGKLAWADQTGEDHYDIKIAARRSRKTIEDFLARAGTHEKILFPVGQDFFHIDNVSNETTSGTRMDVDGRLGETIPNRC